jgi:phosphopantothenoylcysteine synthetase/decarboxylase
MNLLVTAGNTLVPIDRVRCITNIFTGRTGAGLGLHAHRHGHQVTLLTSHPEVVAELNGGTAPADGRWRVCSYRTFEDLQSLMADKIREVSFDAIIHSAAVSDYRATGIYAPSPDTRFNPVEGTWSSSKPMPPALVDRTAAKVKSDEPELWLRLVRLPKLIDRIRPDWGFRNVMVKFKLEADIGEAELLDIAERSRRHSQADLMVANTLEGTGSWAFIGPVDGIYERVTRHALPERLLSAVERLHGEKKHG